MGLEVGWHLRFSRTDVIEVLLDARSLAQVADHAGWIGGWVLQSEERDGYVLARLSRGKKTG